MNKMIFFKNDDCSNDYCSGEIYSKFLDYAFKKCSYFMLVYVNYYGRGYTKKQKYFKTILNRFKVKSRSNPSWPGTLSTSCPNTTYKIVFYRTDPIAKEILKEVRCLSDWSRPSLPEDLAFFQKNHCWFYSVGHEIIQGIIRADEEDLAFVESIGLANKENSVPFDEYYLRYDETLE